LVEIFSTKSGRFGGFGQNGGRLFWPTSKMTRIVKTLVPSPRFENRGENTRSRHKETVSNKKKKQKQKKKKQIYRRILTDEQKLCHWFKQINPTT
jgi:hypothetical protein